MRTIGAVLIATGLIVMMSGLISPTDTHKIMVAIAGAALFGIGDLLLLFDAGREE